MKHYKTLNVPKNADKHAIKKAYRSKAREAHPDMGGSQEAMIELNLAYAVLSDDSRRESYDRTGKDEPPQDLLAEAITIVAQIFNQTLEQNHPRPVQFLNLALEGNLRSINQQQITTKSCIAKLKRLRGKVSVKNGENLYHQILDQRIAQLNANLVGLARAEQAMTKAKEVAEAYSEDHVDPPVAPTMYFASGTSTLHYPTGCR